MCVVPISFPPVPLCQAYRAACHYGDSEEEVEESMRIASSAVYNKLMLFVLVRGKLQEAVQRCCGRGEVAWRQQKLLILFLGSCCCRATARHSRHACATTRPARLSMPALPSLPLPPAARD